MQSSTTAFHPVQANRTFARPSPAEAPRPVSTVKMSATSTKERQKKVDWPQPLRKYVQRAFMPEHNIPGIGRIEMENKLKETITEANEKNTLYTIDWDHLPLPQQLIQNESAPVEGSTTGTSWWLSGASADAQASAGLTMKDGQSSTKKRKSSDLYTSREDNDAPRPPWHKTNNRNLLEDRVTSLAPAFGGRLNIQQPKSSDERPGKQSGKHQNGDSAKRQRRFDHRGSGPSTAQSEWVSHETAPAPVKDEGPVVGRSQALEKKYFRLTAPPNPDTVRPLPVLRMTLDLLKQKWKEDNNYSYICDQFKSLRQDLTVQHIKNEFTVHIYEIHARIALEKGDLGEYNQCQTQLRGLYAQHLGGHPMEFKAYRILYFIHTCNRTDMNDVLANLTPAEKKDPAVKHALDVRCALALGNYHRFFRLYLDTPNMGAYLMDMFVDRERLAALAKICRTYKPDVPLRFLTEELAFESDPETAQFLTNHQLHHLLEVRDDNDHHSCYRVLTGKAASAVEEVKNNAFRRVDIKGQI